MSRTRASFTPLFAAQLLLAACGSSGASTGASRPSPDTTAQPAASTTAEARAPITIKVIEIPRTPDAVPERTSPTASASASPDAPPAEIPWPTFTRDERAPPRTTRVYAMDAIDVVSSMQPLFRRCFDRALKDQRGITGEAKLGVHVDGSGTVDRVDQLESSGLPQRLIDCCIDAAKSRLFPAPGGKGIDVVVPIGFTR